MQFPLVSRREYHRLKLENYTLRDALRNANEELQRHRRLLAGLRTGQTEMTAAVERALSR